jgi:hypothetical protein
MIQSSAGSSADHARIPGDPGATASNLIFFCDQCGFRIPAADFSARKARLLDEVRATCVNCSRKRSGATGALRPTDASSRRSTRHIPVPPPSEHRSSQRGMVSAARDEPAAVHGHAVAEHAEGKTRGLLVPVGLGVTVLIVIIIAVVLAGRPAPPGPVKPDRVADKGGTILVVPPPQPPPDPGPGVVGPVTKDSTKVVVVDDTKQGGSSTDDYDPRAAVAASLLAQAKAQQPTDADEQLEYKSRLEKIRDSYARTPAAIEAEKLLGELKNLPPVQDLVDTIPDAKEYRLVYDLNMNRLGASISYDRDERANITQPFDRIAYLVELKPKSGTKQWVFVSMDAFTDDIGKIGIPTLTSGASFQQNVTNLNVASNVDGITTGTGLSGGNIEFWPSNYGNRNAADVPNATNDKYDFGDEKTQPVDGYGSMQVHNHEAKQTIFAINHWRQGGNGADLGIGNRPRDNPDWTFSNSAGSYGAKRLRVFVHLK